MDRDDVEEIVRAVLAEREATSDSDDGVVTHMIRVDPFDVVDVGENPMRVIGLGIRDGALEWVVVREGEFGELIPAFALAGAYRPLAANDNFRGKHDHHQG